MQHHNSEVLGLISPGPEILIVHFPSAFEIHFIHPSNHQPPNASKSSSRTHPLTKQSGQPSQFGQLLFIKSLPQPKHQLLDLIAIQGPITAEEMIAQVLHDSRYSLLPLLLRVLPRSYPRPAASARITPTPPRRYSPLSSPALPPSPACCPCHRPCVGVNALHIDVIEQSSETLLVNFCYIPSCIHIRIISDSARQGA